MTATRGSLVSARRARLAASAALSPAAGAGAAGTDLAITGVRVFPLREPVSRRTYTVLRVETRAGLSGYGECPRISAADRAAAEAILTGKPATAYEVLDHALAGAETVRGAVNMALLDIAGKASKAPVYQILGGPTRRKARALAPLPGDGDNALIASLKSAHGAGYRSFLVPAPVAKAANQGRAFVLETRRRLEALRAAAGEDANFVLDGGGRLSPGDAASLCAELERFHLLWFDEPCAVSNVASLRKLTAERVTPIGFGRKQMDPEMFLPLLAAGAIDVLRPDVSRAGLTRIRRMAALSETYYVAVAPYHGGGPVATAAALHLAASLPNFFAQQIPLPEAEADRRMRVEIAGIPVETVRDGFAVLPSGPGLGLAVNESALAKYREEAA